jgi:anti-sigma factor RsiW
MITCREVVELLGDFVSDELPPQQRERLEQHLHGCPPCVLYLESYRAIIRLPRQALRITSLPPHLEARLRFILNDYLKIEHSSQE